MDLLIVVFVVVALVFYKLYYKKNLIKRQLLDSLKREKIFVQDYPLREDLFHEVQDYRDIFITACNEAISIQAFIAVSEHLQELSEDYEKISANSKYDHFDIRKWNKTISPLVDSFDDELKINIYNVFNVIYERDKRVADELLELLDGMIAEKNELFSNKVLDFIKSS